MATNKMNDIGTKKSVLVWLLANKACLVCKTKIAFSNDFQIDHVISKQWFIDNGIAVNNNIENLGALCKSCNSEKQNQCIEFYESKNIEAYKFLLTFQKVSKGITDIRNLMKAKVRNIDGQVITKQVLDGYCDAYAMKYPTSKFAKIHREGKFYLRAS